jgi:hypothetical protein
LIYVFLVCGSTANEIIVSLADTMVSSTDKINGILKKQNLEDEVKKKVLEMRPLTSVEIHMEY